MQHLKNSTVFDCNLLYLPKIHNRAGNLTPLNGGIDIPFNIERVYYLYDVPGGENRGGHAHRDLYQLIVAASGSFDVIIDDSRIKRTITLNRPYMGLLIIPGIWRELTNFSSGAVSLVLASMTYAEADYIREYDEFVQIKQDF